METACPLLRGSEHAVRSERGPGGKGMETGSLRGFPEGSPRSQKAVPAGQGMETSAQEPGDRSDRAAVRKTAPLGRGWKRRHRLKQPLDHAAHQRDVPG